MTEPARSTVIRLDELIAAGLAGDGVHRRLASDDGDLNVNLAHLDAGSTLGEHVNDEVDVVVLVLAGSGRLRIDDADHDVVTSSLAYVARGSRRSIDAGPDGLTYLTAHRARGPLQLRARTDDAR
jgi:quercetin dioxygenase-like cupin family protein